MASLYLTHQHSYVQQDGEGLIVKIPADKKTGKPAHKKRVPLVKVERVIIQGNVTLSGGVVRLLLKKQIPVAYCSYYGKFEGMLSPALSKNGLLRQAQHEASRDYAKRVAVAREVIIGKVRNQRALLMRNNKKHKISQVAQTIADLEKVMTWLSEADLPENWSDAQALLMGQEGSAAQKYLQAYRLLLRNPMGFEKRTRRPPRDPINAMLSFGYVLLSNQVASAIQIASLDPYIGFLHSPRHGNKALAFDLVEEFRAPVVDSIVLRLVNTQTIKPTDFEADGMAINLTERGRKIFLQALEERLNSKIQHVFFKKKTSYRHALTLQVRILIRYIQGEIPAYIPFKVR